MLTAVGNWVLVDGVAEVGFPHFPFLSIAVAAGRVVSCNLWQSDREFRSYNTGSFPLCVVQCRDPVEPILAVVVAGYTAVGEGIGVVGPP